MKAQYGPEEMLYPNKQLYRYNIRNGDEIIIDSKLNRFVSTSSTTSSIRSWRRFSSESSDDTKHTWQLLGSCWPPVKSEWDIEISIADQFIRGETRNFFTYYTHTHTPNNCSRKKYINLSILQGWERVDNDTIERRVCAWIMAARESLKLKIFTILGRIRTCF